MKQEYTNARGALDGVETFVRVAERASFRQAAADLGVTPSAVSQSIRALEARLGIALFSRTTRSVGLTEAGATFLEGVRPAFDSITSASEAVREFGKAPSGLLRLTVPRAVVPLIIEPILASFCEHYPRVTVEIVANEGVVDLAQGRFDAAIRPAEYLDADMVAVRLTPSFRFAVVGSPAYLARRESPATPADLRRHACIRVRRGDGSFAPWRLMGNAGPVDFTVTGPLIAHDLPAAMGAALSGVGLAHVPEPLASDHVQAGRLTEVLVPYASTSDGVFLCFPDRRQVAPKLRAFIDHIRTTLPWHAS